MREKSGYKETRWLPSVLLKGINIPELFLLPAAGHFSPSPSEWLRHRADKNGALEETSWAPSQVLQGLFFSSVPVFLPSEPNLLLFTQDVGCHESYRSRVPHSEWNLGEVKGIS